MDSPTKAERLEASVRRLMAQHARIAPRGFDSTRERDRLHRLIDTGLDEWLLNAPVVETVAAN